MPIGAAAESEVDSVFIPAEVGKRIMLAVVENLSEVGYLDIAHGITPIELFHR
jgi:hypothetical protein